METVITTLPITPSQSSPFQRFYSPLIADIISRLTGAPFMLFCNTVGMKTSYRVDEQQRLFELYKSQLHLLQISCTESSHDGSKEYQEYFSKLLNLIRNKNIFDKVEMDLAWCQCGRVEIPMILLKHIPTMTHGYRRLVSYEGIKPVCVVCKGELRYSSELVEVIRLPDMGQVFSIVPAKYSLQAQNDYDFIINHPTLISRNHRNDSLDTEFRWLPFVRYLTRRQFQRVVLVVPPTHLLKAVKVAVFTKYLNPDLSFDIFIHPLIRIRDGRINFKGLSVAEFVRVCGGFSQARGFMALGTQWSSLDSIIESKELHFTRLCVNHLGIVEEPSQMMSLESIPGVLNRERMQLLFKKIRSYQDVAPIDEQLLSAVFAK